MAETEVENMEKQKGGENVENKEARWPLRIEAKLNSEAETALAKNGIDYGHDKRIVNGNTFVMEIPIYPEDLKKYRALYISDEQAKIRRCWHPYKFWYCYNSKKPDGFLLEGDDCPDEYDKEHDWLNVSKRYPLLGNGETNDFDIKDINRNIVEWIEENGQLPDRDTARDIVIKTLEQFEDYMEHRKEMFEEYIAKKREREIKEQEEWLAKQKAEEEKREREKQKKINAILSKPWVQKLKDAFEVEEMRNKEIQRFKEKFNLTDEEIQVTETYDKPYVHITAKVDLHPLNIDRIVYIRNYYPDEWENMDHEDRDNFSDYANNLADKLAELFGGSVRVFDNRNEGYSSYNAWLVVGISETDNIEVASREIYEDDC